MTVSELRAGVLRGTALAVLAAAVVAGGLGGVPGALGVLSGGALAALSFRSLAARVAAVTGPVWTAPVAGRAEPVGRGESVTWVVLAGLRFLVVSAAAVTLFATGWAHPVAWLAGYTALPLMVVAQGLRLAREERSA
jgi:hypothetical protein